MLIPLFGSGIKGKSETVTAQDRINVYVEMPKDPEKGQIALYGFPGMVEIVDLDDRTWDSNEPTPVALRGYSFPVAGRIRALGVGVFSDETTQTYLWAIKGSAVWTLDESDNEKDNGRMQVNGAVDDAKNRALVAPMLATSSYVLDGRSRANFVFPPAGTLAESGTGSVWVQELTDTDIPLEVTSATAVGGWIVATNQGSPNIIYWPVTTDPLTPSPVDPLDFQQVQDSGDIALRVMAHRGLLVVFCRGSTEFFSPTGDVDIPFAPMRGASVGYGLAALHGAVAVNDVVVFLARNANGQNQVVMMSGQSAAPISDPDLEKLINDVSDVSDCVAIAYAWAGHTFVQFNFTTGNLSLVYDMQSRVWSRLSDVDGNRHRADFAVNWNGVTYLSDYENGKIYTFSDTTHTLNGDEWPREVTSRHFFKDFDRVIVDEVVVDFEVGLGSEAGSDPQVMLQISKDNGKSWGTELWKSLGKIGETRSRVVWRRLGQGRDWTFRLRVTDPVRFVIAAAAINAQPVIG